MQIVKKTVCLLTAVIMAVGFSACGKKENGGMMSVDGGTAASFKDGEYKASANSFDEQCYKATVELTVKDNKVYSIDCDAEHRDGGTKKAHSESGKYNMKSGGASMEWHEEIALFEEAVVKNGVESVTVASDGKTDTVTGCTIAVGEYVKLIKEALEKAKK